MRVSPASYFDTRAMLNFYVSQLVALVVAIVTIPFTGLTFYHALLLIPFFIGFGQVFLHLPIRSKIYDCEYPEYGFYWYAEGKTHHSLWLCLGKKKKCFYMPWNLTWVRTSVLLKDGTWEHETKGNVKDFYEIKWDDLILKESHPYTYKLNSGSIQEVVATIKTEEREWRPIITKRWPIFKSIRRTISIDFDKEVGERAGSWKGGTVGCSWELKHNETPLEALRRMESERRFS